jgi:hypothetical protein
MNQEDRNQIIDLIAKNSYYYDYNQPEKRRTLFTDNLKAETWFGGELRMNLSNSDEFIATQHKRRASLSEQGIQPRHYNTDIALEEVSEGVVIGSVMHLTTWQRLGEKKPEIVHTGVYDFEFKKLGKEWKISKRISYIDHA